MSWSTYMQHPLTCYIKLGIAQFPTFSTIGLSLPTEGYLRVINVVLWSTKHQTANCKEQVQINLWVPRTTLTLALCIRSHDRALSVYGLMLLAEAKDSFDEVCDNSGPHDDNGEEGDCEWPGEPQQVVGAGRRVACQWAVVVVGQHPDWYVGSEACDNNSAETGWL